MDKTFGTRETFGSGRRRGAWLAATIFVSSVAALIPGSPTQAVGVPDANYVVVGLLSSGIDTPADVVVSPDGDFVYISNSGDTSISIFDTTDGNFVDTDPGEPGTTPLDVGGAPTAMAITSDGDDLFVVVNDEDVIQIDTTTFAISPWTTLPGAASDIAIRPDGNRIYYTIPGTDDVYGSTYLGAWVHGYVLDNPGFEYEEPTSVAWLPNNSSGEYYAFIANAGESTESGVGRVKQNQGAHGRQMAYVDDNTCPACEYTNPQAVAISPDGEWGAVINPDGKLLNFTTDDIEFYQRGAGGTADVTAIAWTDDNTLLSARGSAGAAGLRDTLYAQNTEMTENNTSLRFTIDEPTGIATTPDSDGNFPIYVAQSSLDQVTVIAEADPELNVATTSGAAGSTVTIDVTTPGLGFDLPGGAITEVTFGGVAATDLTWQMNNSWTVTAPAGTGVVPVVVKFALGGRPAGSNLAAAGDFTYVATGGGGGVSASRATFDPAGGTCGVNSTIWTVEFKGTYPLPTAAECRRDGYALLGWTRDPKLTSREDLLTSVVTRPRIMTAVWGKVPAAPSQVDVFANFLCGQCTAAIVLWPASPNASETPVISVDNVERTCTASGPLFDLRWCWITGLSSNSAHSASVAWRNQNGAGPATSRPFSLN